ncbi:hypothetical protein ACVWWU_003931 [Pantoea sp. PA1]
MGGIEIRLCEQGRSFVKPLNLNVNGFIQLVRIRKAFISL